MLIIVEGTDRTGKDSLIKGLAEHFHGSDASLMIKHWGFPLGNTNEEKTAYQKEMFRKEFERYDILKKGNHINVIWNRSHIGELVYGPMYRNSVSSDWIFSLEKEFKFDSSEEVFLIYLYGDPNFLIKNDDGQSFTNEVVKKTEELQRFEEAVAKSNIQNKLILKVNHGDQYVNKNELLKRVLSFITQ
jgi:thymidylate kinase